MTRKLLEETPWIERLSSPVQCEGPVRRGATFRWLECKAPGYWRYEALSQSWFRSGTYCYTHCFCGMFNDNAERGRWYDWRERGDAATETP